jgi:hypothetical protein
MSKDKKALPVLRSSAAEYLTFIAASGEGGVEAIYADEDIWLSQKMMAALYDVNVRTVSDHLKKLFTDNELEPEAVIRKFRITATDGKTSAEIAKAHAESEFEKYRIVQDRLYQSDFDKVIKHLVRPDDNEQDVNE